MTTSREPSGPFRYFNGSREIICPDVTTYERYPLSHGNGEALLFERGIDAFTTAVHHWCDPFAPPSAGDTWRQGSGDPLVLRHHAS